MWEGGTSIRRKERINFSLHLFCSFWHNFEEQMIKLPTLLCLIVQGGGDQIENFWKKPSFFLIIIRE